MPLSLSGTTGIVTGNIGTLQVTTGRLANDAVTTAKILNANVTPEKLSQPMTLMSGQNATGTDIDFTGIPSWVNRVTVIFNEVGQSATANTLVQIGDSGGIEATGYISTSIVVDTAGLSTGGSSTTGFIWYGSGTRSGLMHIVRAGGNVWVASHTGKIDTIRSVFGAGSKTLSSTLDRVRITAGTYNAGSINVIYEG